MLKFDLQDKHLQGSLVPAYVRRVPVFGSDPRKSHSLLCVDSPYMWNLVYLAGLRTMRYIVAVVMLMVTFDRVEKHVGRL